MNPSVSTTNVAGSSPVLVFEGTGKVLLSGSNVRFGTSGVSAADSSTWLDIPTAGLQFCAPAEIYAVCINSATNMAAKVQVWF